MFCQHNLICQHIKSISEVDFRRRPLVSATKLSAVYPFSAVSCEVRPRWIGLFQPIIQMWLDCDLGNLEPILCERKCVLSDQVTFLPGTGQRCAAVSMGTLTDLQLCNLTHSRVWWTVCSATCWSASITFFNNLHHTSSSVRLDQTGFVHDPTACPIFSASNTSARRTVT